MSATGVQKFLSKRERPRSLLSRHRFGKNHQVQLAAEPLGPSSDDFFGLFIPKGPASKDEDVKVKNLHQKLLRKGVIEVKDAQILWALRSEFGKNSLDDAYKLVLLMVDSWEGLVREYKPTTKLLGAINRQNVTCYLDALLFAMFSRLGSFEAMLYNTFNTPAKQRLALLLRLWVNMLRSGELITTDITEMVQKALSDCGWPDAYELHQQDASEAFTFITSQLELPLLTLKMDIYHTGKEDAADDHKFINERLLEVAIPSPAPEEPQTVTLEDCLEAYFNNRIEVRRYLERRERSNTTSSAKSFDSFSKAGAVHVETLEVESPESPGSTPATPTASMPARLRHRAPSIVQQRFIPDKDAPSGDRASVVSAADPAGQLRKGSIRKEIMMPAWQIFSLIPWYTDNTPTSDTQVAAHFSSQRPVLGMCLKRYSMTPSGQATRLGTYVDIPVEIGLPYFIKDDNMDEDASLYGNFKLSLQSVVCHRGNSVDSGHYISLVRGTTASTSTLDVVAEAPKQWMRFDDLASERITIIDIEQALKEETPYLLFYQILPIDGDPDHITEGEQPSVVNSDMGDSGGDMGSSTVLKENVVKDLSASELTIDSERLSVDDQRGRSPERDSNRRSSLSFSEPEVAVQDQATFSQLTSRRGSKCENIKSGKFSRSQSQTSEKLTAALSRLTQRKSKEKVSFDGVPSATASHSSTAVTPLMSITNGSTDPEVSLIEVTDFSAAPATKTSLDNVNAHSHRQRQNKGKAPARTLSKREKSKSRLRDRLHSGSASDEEKLDRECIVM